MALLLCVSNRKGFGGYRKNARAIAAIIHCTTPSQYLVTCVTSYKSHGAGGNSKGSQKIHNDPYLWQFGRALCQELHQGRSAELNPAPRTRNWDITSERQGFHCSRFAFGVSKLGVTQMPRLNFKDLHPVCRLPRYPARSGRRPPRIRTPPAHQSF